MRIRGDGSKLGALCRWVRSLDVVSGLSTYPNMERSAKENEFLLVLDAILRQTDFHPLSSLTTFQDTWNLRDSLEPTYLSSKGFLDGVLRFTGTSVQFRLCTRSSHKPPNYSPQYSMLQGPMRYPSPATANHKHPTVPNLSLI
jgi:hypothetical protein